MSCVINVGLISGPIASALANKYGIRAVTIVGSIVASVAFFLSTFAPSLNVLIVTYGVLGGQYFITIIFPLLFSFISHFSTLSAYFFDFSQVLSFLFMERSISRRVKTKNSQNDYQILQLWAFCFCDFLFSWRNIFHCGYKLFMKRYSDPKIHDSCEIKHFDIISVIDHYQL